MEGYEYFVNKMRIKHVFPSKMSGVEWVAGFCMV